MKLLIKIVCLAISMTCYNTVPSMTTLKKAKDIPKVLQTRTVWQPKTQIPPLTITTEPLIEPKTPSTLTGTKQKEPTPLTITPWKQLDIQKWNAVKTFLWGQWANFKGKIQDILFTPVPTIIASKQAKLETVLLPTLPTIQSQPSIMIRPNSAQSLPEAEKILKNQETVEQNKQQKLLNIPDQQWHNLLQRTQQHITWIKNNCFQKHNPDATHDKIPGNIYDRILFFLKKAQINPSSINIRYQDTTHIDPFDHKTISVEGPTLEYIISPAFQGDAITGYKPATLTLHSQIVSTLSPNELDAEIQHVITHLTQGHNEQLKILENSIGAEQYKNYIKSPEGRQFIASLETTADFLEPIKNPEVAKIVQKAFFEKAFDSALNEIKENRKKHNLENRETGLMVCTPPGIELEFLAQLRSFDDIETYFKTEKETILRNAGLNDDEIKKLEDELKNDKNYLEKNYYQTPIDGIFHDPTLAPEILDKIKELLQNAGINPFSVEIINNTKEQMKGFAYAQGPIVENGIVKRKAQLGFCQEYINDDQKIITFAIGHEIGHLIRNHCTQFSNIRDALTKDFINKHNIIHQTDNKGKISLIFWPEQPKNLDLELEKISDDTLHNIKSLAELEADTTYLMHDINQAKSVHSTLIQIIAAAKKDTSKPNSPVHMSLNNRFHWSNRILQLHAKEKTQKNKPFTPSITRE